MLSPFPVPIADLRVEHVHAFLTDAEEEGVTWEAKADGIGEKARPLRPEKIRNGICGLANQVGGHFIIGAAQVPGEGWRLVGVKRRQDDHGLWLDQILRGLQPRPRVRHRVFHLDEGRWAAVIEIEPLTQTPCMTADGQVFERVSSETVKVTDPTRLQQLYLRGQQARDRAEQLAVRAVDGVHASMAAGVHVSIGLAASSYEPDISSRLFHSRFRARLDEAVEQHLFRALDQPTAPRTAEDARIGQSFMQRTAGGGDVQWTVCAQRDGAVGVTAWLTGSALKHLALLDFVLLPAWRLAAELVESLGGYGDARAHIAIQRLAVDHDLGTFYRGLPGRVDLDRWAVVAAPDDQAIGSIQRELQRAAGFWSFEGVPDPPAG